MEYQPNPALDIGTHSQSEVIASMQPQQEAQRKLFRRWKTKLSRFFKSSRASTTKK